MKRTVLWGLAISAVVGGAVSYYACSSPDGLERAAEMFPRTGQTEPAADLLPALMPDYTVPGIANRRISGGLAGVAGVAVTFALCMVVGRLLSRRARPPNSDIE